jgi:hypothetical protein
MIKRLLYIILKSHGSLPPPPSPPYGVEHGENLLGNKLDNDFNVLVFKEGCKATN